MTGFPFISYDSWMMSRFGTVYRINPDPLLNGKYRCVMADLPTTERVENEASGNGFTLSKMSARKTWMKAAPPVTMFGRAKNRAMLSLTPVRALQKCYKPGFKVTQSKLPPSCALCFNAGYVENRKCPCGITVNYKKD